MREIKFRFWTPDKRMVDDHDGWIEDTGINYALACSKSYGYIAMQFTGLYDKNNVPIYEGDIVKCGESEDAMLAIIVFEQQAFVLKYLPEELPNVYDYMEDYKHFEVLGNIYENKNLLQ